MTQAGVVLGTAAYMSPEQARGQVADARSDIWAFGCVLFELLTGRRAFPGDTIADVTTAVLSREPDWGQLPAAARGQVVHVLRRCLARERRERYGAIADVRYDLLERPAPPTTESTTARRHGVASLLAAAVGGALVVALGVGLTRTAPVPPTSDTLTGAMLIASTGRMQFGHAEVALDPGGRSVAYESADDSGLNRIWIQPLDGRDARPVQGTEGGRGPAFSNDGRWLAFTANARLMKVAVEGGRALTLADAPHMHGAAWTTDDRAIVFAPTLTRGLWRVPAEGGAASQLTRVDAAAGELSHEWPVIAPNGRLHFVVNAQLRPFDDSHIAVVDDSTGTWSTVVRHALAPRFDHAGRLFHLDGTGAIVVNDPATVNPSRLAAQVFTVSGNGLYSIAGNGVLVFARALDYGRRELIVATPDGQRRVVSDQRPYLALAVSPDARRVAASVVGGAVLVSDIARPAWTVTTATAYRPRLLWTPDSRRIVFTPGPGRLALIDPAGRTDEEPMSLPNVSSALAWLPGTLALIVRTLTSPTLFVHTLGVPDDRVLTGFEQYPSMLFAAVEPKRRLIPYGSDYTGRHDVYLRPLEGREPAIRVTTGNPGTEPLWSADGRQLFFADGAQGLKVVEVTAPPLSVSPERPVAGVDTKAASIGDRQTYAALPDGSILFVQEGDTTERDRVYVFQDWRALLHAAAGQR
jgi:Tol biopolymer transport system component